MVQEEVVGTSKKKPPFTTEQEVCGLCQTPGVSLIAFLCLSGFPSSEKKTRVKGTEKEKEQTEQNEMAKKQ